MVALRVCVHVQGLVRSFNFIAPSVRYASATRRSRKVLAVFWVSVLILTHDVSATTTGSRGGPFLDAGHGRVRVRTEDGQPAGRAQQVCLDVGGASACARVFPSFGKSAHVTVYVCGCACCFPLVKVPVLELAS